MTNLMRKGAEPIKSTMGDAQLSIANIVSYGTTAYAAREVVSYDGVETRRSTLGDVGRRAAQLAHALTDDFGVTVGDVVATFMWNTQAHFESYLAVPSMGAVLHTLNVRYTDDQVVYTSEHVGDRIIIVDPSLVEQLVRLLPRLPSVREVIVTGDQPLPPQAEWPADVRFHRYDDVLRGRATHFEWPELPEQSAALMCYTSGTTGDPKGVVYSHRSAYLVSMQLCMGNYLALSTSDVVLLVVPMFHANSWSFPYAAMMVGASVVLPGRYVQSEHLAKLIQQERPTVSAGVPTIWSDLLQHARATGIDLSSLRHVVVGGSVCSRTLMEAYENEYGVHLLHGWGMTEMSPIGSIARADGLNETDAWALRMTQGRFVCTVQARVAAPDGSLAPHDGATVGEIETRGPWVTSSYYRQPDGAGFHDGWLRTGDVGTINPEGVLHLRDRIKDVIKSGGEWISSLELEEVIENHPEVADVAVLGVPDDRWGERPLAILTLRTGAAASVTELASYVGTKVDRWQVPERWSVVPALPRTSVGKTDKARLRHLYDSDGLKVQFVEVPKA